MKQLLNSIQTKCEQLGIDLEVEVVLGLIEELNLNPHEVILDTDPDLLGNELKINGRAYLVLDEDEAQDLAFEKVYDAIVANGVNSTQLNALDYVSDLFIEELSESLIRREVLEEMSPETIDYYLEYYNILYQSEIIECLTDDIGGLDFIQSKMKDDKIIFLADLKDEIQIDYMATDLLEILGRGSQFAYDEEEIQFKVDGKNYCAYLIE